MEVFDVTTSDRQVGLDAAIRAVKADSVICLPTDTVYGIGANPFSYDAVTNLLTAKSRTRAMPPPVLVADADQAASLVSQIPTSAKALMNTYWPGALTIILPASEDLGWDLGETHGTVALRMPDSEPTRELLTQVGPLAVTSANKTGEPPALDVGEAVEQLGEAIAVYLDGCRVAGGVPSTILRWIPDADSYEVIRLGALDLTELANVVHIKEQE